MHAIQTVFDASSKQLQKRILDIHSHGFFSDRFRNVIKSNLPKLRFRIWLVVRQIDNSGVSSVTNWFKGRFWTIKKSLLISVDVRIFGKVTELILLNVARKKTPRWFFYNRSEQLGQIMTRYHLSKLPNVRVNFANTIFPTIFSRFQFYIDFFQHFPPRCDFGIPLR